MGLDIRLPIGLMFGLLGAVLAIYGVVSDPAIYARSLGYNVNLWWGVTLLVFGAICLYLGRGSAAALRRRSDTEAEGQQGGTAEQEIGGEAGRADGAGLRG